MDNQTPNPLDTISQALAQLAEHRTSTDAVFNDLRFLEFRSKKGDSNVGKGLIFSGEGHTKQLVLGHDSKHLFSTESFGLDRDREFLIGGVKVLTSAELGPTVTKSNIRELGRLKGLIIDGSFNVNDYFFYNGSVDRLGLGTESPNSAFSIAENSIEVMIGTVFETGHGMIGTFASHDLDIVTDDTVRITVKANGNVDIGNPTKNPIQVTVHGKLAVGVKVPDTSVDLHVNGAVRLNNHIQKYAPEAPIDGSYTMGDIVWNSEPRVGACVGWVCTRAGNPGLWNPFGEIKERGN
jgi:hypothetical protein